MNILKKLTLLILFIFMNIMPILAQVNETPNAYTWKGNKTELTAGYVILRSDKKLEGKISLKGSAQNIEEVYFEGDGKEINFPLAALKAYGLNVKSTSGPAAPVKSAALKYPINESPESMYEWNYVGVVMDKKIYTTEARKGYVVLKNGKRYEGNMKLKRKDDKLDQCEIKTSNGKEKIDIEDIARYGYSVSEESVVQENLSEMGSQYYPGYLETSKGLLEGEIARVTATDSDGRRKFYFSEVILKDQSGVFSKYDASNINRISQTIEGENYAFIPVEGLFVHEKFNGSVFQLYRNPKPTTINERATTFAKLGTAVGTEVAAGALANKGVESTNLDSIIRVSSTDELRELSAAMVRASGYPTKDALLESDDKNIFKNDVAALELAIAGREIAESDDGIKNEEWYIFNKKSGTKTIVYKSNLRDELEPLLLGCYEYLSLEKKEQNEYLKWDNLTTTMEFLDKCY